MFGADPPQGRSIDQLRGIEGARVKQGYLDLAKKWDIRWDGRSYDVHDFGASDPINKAISCATTCLYGLAEAVVVSLGYSPAIGFIHRGDARSFVFDVADTLKMESVLPLAFEQASKGGHDLESRVRAACRDIFREMCMAERLVTVVEEVLAWRSLSSK